MITWAILTVRTFEWTVRNAFHLWILSPLHLSMLPGKCECIALLISFIYSSFKQQFSLLALMCICWVTEVLSWKVPPSELWWVTLIIHTLHTQWTHYDSGSLLWHCNAANWEDLNCIEIFHKMRLGDIGTEWSHFPPQGLSFGVETLAFI